MCIARPSQRFIEWISCKSILALACLFCTSLGTIDTAASQTLSFSAGGGSLSLVIDTATAGSEPDDAPDSSTEMSWDADFGFLSKITVSTLCVSQDFQLFVDFTVTSGGSGTMGDEQGEIELVDGMFDADLFTNIPFSSPARIGTATLSYRASATVSDGNSAENGDDFHSITFTILAQ